MLSAEGQVKVLDLGLALLHDEQIEHGDTGLTSSSQIMGTADYMAPEQAIDTHSVDVRADIYSLGCTLFFLLTARPPYAAAQRRSAFETLTAHARDPIPSIHHQRTDVPSELAAIIERMLDKQPEGRPDTPNEVAFLLQPFTTDADLAALNYAASQSLANELDQPTGTAQLLSETRQHEPATPAASSKPVVSSSKSNRRRWPVAIAAVALPLIICAGIIIHIATDRGEVVIDAAPGIAEDLTISVLKDGQTVREGWQLRPGSDNRMTIRTGAIAVELPTLFQDKYVVRSPDDLLVTRSGVTVFRIERRAANTSEDQEQAATSAKTTSELLRDQGRGEWPLGPAEDVLPGVIRRPATFEGVERWNVVRAGPTAEIRSVSWSPDGQFLAVVTHYPYVRIYEFADGSLRLKRLLPKENGFGNETAAWSPDGKWLAVSGGPSKTVQLWDAQTFELGPSHKHGTVGCSLSWSSDSKRLAIGSYVGINIWELATNTAIVIAEEEQAVRPLAPEQANS